MTGRTPPLPALRAFAAFVRLGSISAAATELSLTQGAVAHQIRALEAVLEVELVERNGRRLTLTEHGRMYGYQVRQALDDLADATELTRRHRAPAAGASPPPMLRVAVLPSFAQGWLLPRLPAFCKLYPEVRLNLQASMAYTDLGAGEADCALRFGHGQWTDVTARPLMGDALLLVAAPDLLRKRKIEALAQVLRLPILHSSENWAGWLSTLEHPTTDVQRPKPRLEFTDSTHLLEAVRLGLGVALTRRSIADQALQRGDIVPAWPHTCQHTSAYYAVLPATAPANEARDQFLGWLQTECSRFARKLHWTEVR